MTESSRCVVAVVGSLNLDLTVVVARAPEEGETVLGRHLRTYPGGKGANQAIGAARLAPTAIVGAVGSDHAADVLRGVQQRAGVDTSHLRTTPGPTGRAVIIVSDDGQNRIVVVPEANSLLKAEDVTTALDALDPAVVLTQLELLPAVTWAAAQWARDHDRRFVLNPSPVIDLDEHVLAGADPLVLNEQEALHYAGLPAGTPFDEIVTRLLEQVHTVVITRGGEDVVVGTEDAIEHLRVPQVDVVDTTGAGDHFAGTLAALLGTGDDLFAAARRASADAARLVASRRSDR
ncbi:MULTISPECIES: ribokinase [Rhodococcus]|uniref:Ribokinase n=1 Tax=Rhodococcus rhodochrous TaxID=1829 RepID=A0AAW4XBN5_RHORH|nr:MULTISPECIES: ribokinase [Rhodococcus]MCD2110354.1 ribokinase [Rhodococcus rhodochrous]QHG80874.1 ribokinase [Rhodococcus rhodochrous]QOH55115.1 ribokinase [Rhodococcus rhodochrous]WAL47186.1 ribokinase [Rhodococcus pyridinivorans]